MNFDRVYKLAWIFFEKFGIVFISIFSFYIYAIELGPAGLGLGVLAVAIVEAIGLFFTSLVEDPLVRRERSCNLLYSTVFYLCLITGVSSAFILLSIAYLLEVSGELIVLLTLASIKLPLILGSRVFIAELRKKGDFKSLATRTLTGKVLGAVTGITMALIGFDAVSIVAQAIVIDLFSFLILFFKERQIISLSFDSKSIRSLFSTGVPNALKAVCVDLTNRGITIVLGAVLSAQSLGLYSLGARIVNLPKTSILNGLLGYALPVFSRRQSDHDGLLEFFIKATKITFTCVAPCFMGLALTSDILVPLIFGDAWTDAIPIMVGLSALVVCYLPFVYISSLLMAVGKPKLTLFGEILTSCACVLCVFLLSPTMGVYAAIAGLALKQLLMIPVYFNALNRALGFLLYRAMYPLIAPTLSVVSMVSVGYVFKKYIVLGDINLLIGTILVSMMTWAVSQYVFNRRWMIEIKEFVFS